MMKFHTGWMVSALLVSCVAGAVEREQLSPALQEMLPPPGYVQVHLKAGGSVLGNEISRDATNIVVQVEQRGVSRKRSLAMSDVARVEAPDYGELLGARLLDFQLDPRRNLPAKDVEAELAKLDDYLQHFPDHPRTTAVRALRTAVAQEAAQLARGMEKVEGRWLGPVQAAVLKFDRADEVLSDLMKQYAGIEQAGFRGKPSAKKQYDTLVQFQRDTARSLPQTIASRMPALLQDLRFDECAEEMSAFMKFWMQRVLRTEVGVTRGSELDALRGMDFQAMVRMQTRILDAWKAHAPPPAPPAALPEGMLFVPAGYFIMGDPKADAAQDHFPAHLVWVDPFLIDRAEVTNGEYRKFLDHVKATADSSMEHPSAPPLKDHTPRGWANPQLAADDQPVVGVDWFDAYAYAKWTGKRLPTEAEWEIAAIGSTGQSYPWGEAAPGERYVSHGAGRSMVATDIDIARPPPPPPPPKRGFLGGKQEPPPARPPTVLLPVTWPARAELPHEAAEVKLDVDPKNARSPCGAIHMAGNAAEWVGDVYDAKYYRVSDVRNPAGPAEGRDHVFRGGSYVDDDPTLLRASRRGNAGGHDKFRQGLTPQDQAFIGFRCAQSLPTAAP